MVLLLGLRLIRTAFEPDRRAASLGCAEEMALLAVLLG